MCSIYLQSTGWALLHDDPGRSRGRGYKGGKTRYDTLTTGTDGRTDEKRKFAINEQ